MDEMEGVSLGDKVTYLKVMYSDEGKEGCEKRTRVDRSGRPGGSPGTGPTLVGGTPWAPGGQTPFPLGPSLLISTPPFIVQRILLDFVRFSSIL